MFCSRWLIRASEWKVSRLWPQIFCRRTLASHLVSKAEERVSVASNWKLVWWRFRKNRLAVISSVVLVFFYMIVLVPDFFQHARPGSDGSLSCVHSDARHFLFDSSGLNLSVPAVVGKRNPVTLRMEWKIDETKKVPIRLFARYRTISSA